MPALLALPRPCMDIVVSHLGTDLPGIQGLMSLLLASRTLYLAHHEAVYQAIKPGCMAPIVAGQLACGQLQPGLGWLQRFRSDDAATQSHIQHQPVMSKCPVRPPAGVLRGMCCDAPGAVLSCTVGHQQGPHQGSCDIRMLPLEALPALPLQQQQQQRLQLQQYGHQPQPREQEHQPELQICAVEAQLQALIFGSPMLAPPYSAGSLIRHIPRQLQERSCLAVLCAPDPAAGPWLLHLPDHCMHLVSARLRSDLPGIQGLVSLLLASRTAYASYADIVYEALDPGCVEALSTWDQSLAAIRRLAGQEHECRGQWPGSAGASDVSVAVTTSVAAATVIVTAAAEAAAKAAAVPAAAGGTGSLAQCDPAAPAVTDPSTCNPYWQQLQCAAAVTVLRWVRPQPRRMCAVRPNVQALWRACHPADKQRGKPRMMWSNVVRKLLPSDAYARLLPEKGGRYHALDVQEQVLLVHGPGTHPHIIADLQQRVEAEAWRLHSTRGDPAAGPWLLALPGNCKELVVRHLCGPVLQLQSLAFLLEVSRLAYKAFAPLVHEGIGAGCEPRLMRFAAAEGGQGCADLEWASCIEAVRAGSSSSSITG